MRCCAVLLLLATLVAAEPLVQIGKNRYVGMPVAMRPIAIGTGTLPVSLTQRGTVRGHLRILSVGAGNYTEVRLPGDALAMTNHRGGVLWATNLKNGSLSFKGLRYDGMRTRASSQDYGTLDVKGWRNLRVLALGASPDGPVAVCAHIRGLEIVHLERRVKTLAHTIPNGARFTAASEPRDLDGDGNTDVIVGGRGMALLRLEQDGRRGYRSRELPFQDNAFVPAAIAAEGGRIALGGAKSGRAMVVLLGGGRRRPGRAPRPAAAPLDLGVGSITHVEFLAGNLLAVAGQRVGRAWVGVVSVGARAQIVADLYLSGNKVRSLATNPERKGWTLAAGSNDQTVYVLRLRGDEARPANWNPFPRPEPEPEPEPEPTPVPAPVPDVRPVEPPAIEQPVPSPPPAAAAAAAYFPRVVADPANGVDTEITLVHIGARPRTLTLRLLDGRGREVAAHRLRLARGRRAVVSIAALLRGARLAGFDGYVRVDGAVRADLVAEAARVRGRWRGEPAQPHWR